VLLKQEGNIEEAKKWFSKAAEQNDPDAQYNLALLLEGEGNREEAKIWYLKAAGTTSNENQTDPAFVVGEDPAKADDEF